MSKEYILYTVKGMREVYYAAVDWESGQVWTAPTKEVADRLAREAGLHLGKEEVIAKDDLMRSLGFGRTLKLKTREQKSKPKERPVKELTLPRPANKAPSSPPATWFMAGEETGGTGPADQVPSLPSFPTGRRKKGRARNKSVFGTSKSIVAPAEQSEDSPDLLIIPSADFSGTRRGTFADGAPPVLKESDEETDPA